MEIIIKDGKMEIDGASAKDLLYWGRMMTALAEMNIANELKNIVIEDKKEAE